MYTIVYCDNKWRYTEVIPQTLFHSFSPDLTHASKMFWLCKSLETVLKTHHISNSKYEMNWIWLETKHEHTSRLIDIESVIAGRSREISQKGSMVVDTPLHTWQTTSLWSFPVKMVSTIQEHWDGWMLVL